MQIYGDYIAEYNIYLCVCVFKLILYLINLNTLNISYGVFMKLRTIFYLALCKRDGLGYCQVFRSIGNVSFQECGGLCERARGGIQKHSAVSIESYKCLSAGETVDHRLEKSRGTDNRGCRQVLRREHHEF